MLNATAKLRHEGLKIKLHHFQKRNARDPDLLEVVGATEKG